MTGSLDSAPGMLVDAAPVEAAAAPPASPVSPVPRAPGSGSTPVPTLPAARPFVTPASSGVAATVSTAWTRRVAAATGIPARALAAYGGAALALGKQQPSCHLSWSALAGLASVESAHASHGGALLAADGYSTPRIIGPALDGTRFDAIPDTDDGRWDGDTRWDRAVGPFQFIPSTWKRWGADASGDGSADPNQIDDAALAAGRYLCASGDLSTPAHWRSAVFSYNHSDSYVTRVTDAANRYATLSR